MKFSKLFYNLTTMEKHTKFLLALFLIIVLSKLILILCIKSPSIFSDEYVYAKLARSIFNMQGISLHGTPQTTYPPLYPAIISLAYAAKNMNLIYALIKTVNVVLSSLIIFPAFYLAKEFTRHKNSLLLAGLISVLPASFVFPAYILSENLFYPLFLAAVFFIYKMFSNPQSKWAIASGIFIGLCTLTRIIGLVLLIPVCLLAVWKLAKKDLPTFKKATASCLLALSIACLWFARNIFALGFTGESILGAYSGIARLPRFSGLSYIAWVLIYLEICALAVGIIFFLILFASRTKTKNENILKAITFILLFAVILIVAKTAAANFIKAETLLPWLTGRPIARYADILLPLVMICGFSFYNSVDDKRLKCACLFLSTTSILGSQLIFFQLFPLNNMSVAWAGILKLGFNMFNQNMFIAACSFCAVLIGIILFSYLLILRKTKIRKIAVLLLAFFLILSLGNFAMIKYNSESNWLNSENSQLGLWLANNIDAHSKVMMDKRDCNEFDVRNSICTIPIGASLIGFWLNSDVILGDPENHDYDYDYLISKHIFDLPIVKRTENGIFVYESQKV